MFDMNEKTDRRWVIRDAVKEDAPFLALCMAAGMHFCDFGGKVADDIDGDIEDLLARMTACSMREDLLESYKRTRVAEMDCVPVGSLLSYSGEVYRELRHKTFTEFWPELSYMEASSEMEADPGEYYLDTLAVHPDYRRQGIGLSLIRDGISLGRALGYRRIVIAADSDFPHLVRLYESAGFTPADHRHAFGVDYQRMMLEV